jgi:hypothetical protein
VSPLKWSLVATSTRRGCGVDCTQRAFSVKYNASFGCGPGVIFNSCATSSGKWKNIKIIVAIGFFL